MSTSLFCNSNQNFLTACLYTTLQSVYRDSTLVYVVLYTEGSGLTLPLYMIFFYCLQYYSENSPQGALEMKWDLFKNDQNMPTPIKRKKWYFPSP